MELVVGDYAAAAADCVGPAWQQRNGSYTAGCSLIMILQPVAAWFYSRLQPGCSLVRRSAGALPTASNAACDLMAPRDQ